MSFRRVLGVFPTVLALAFVGTNAQAVSAPPGVNDFLNIVKLDDCSASIVRFTSSQETDNAMVLTNGHCLPGDLMGHNGEHFVNKSVTRKMNVMNAKGDIAGSLQATKLMYATMTGTDVALYQTSSTYQQVKQKYGVSGLVISETGPTLGRKVTVSSGYWKTRYSCTVDAMVYGILPNGPRSFWMRDAVRYNPVGNCVLKGGTSGSPVIDNETGQVVVVNNSGNDDPVTECKGESTCEVDENGKVTARGPVGYAVPTAWFYTCLDERRQINLKRPGCKLSGGDSLPAKPNVNP